MQAASALLALTLCISLAAICHAQGDYDMCSPPARIRKGGSFIIGFAFWPNGALEDWGDMYSGIHPCDAKNQTVLLDAGGGVSFFRGQVDKLTMLVTRQQLQNPYYAGNTSINHLVSMVAFRGRFRSPPRIISYSDGFGVRIVDTLTLVARFDRGMMKGLEWLDFPCSRCFPNRHRICLREQGQESCAYIGNDCRTVGSCLTGIHLAYEGNDWRSEILQTTYQLRNIMRASIADIYRRGRAVVVGIANAGAGGGRSAVGK